MEQSIEILVTLFAFGILTGFVSFLVLYFIVGRTTERCRDCKRIIWWWMKGAQDIRPAIIHQKKDGSFFVDYICEECYRLMVDVEP